MKKANKTIKLFKKSLEKGQAAILSLVFVTLMAGGVQMASESAQLTNKYETVEAYPVVIPDGKMIPSATPTPYVLAARVSRRPASDQPAAVPTGDVLSCIKRIESGGNYGAVNAAGYYGAYQFDQGTWNSTANASGRTDLVGVNPAQAAPADQDQMANALIARRGLQPWPTPNRVCQ